MEYNGVSSRKNNRADIRENGMDNGKAQSPEENVVDFFNKRAQEIAEEEKIALDAAMEILTNNFSKERIIEILEVEKAAKRRNYNIPQCCDCGGVYNGREFVPLSDEEKKYLKSRNLFFSPAYCRPCVRKIRENIRKR
ncbi:MAG: hypothetical protein ABID38_03255 [Candidatus Diapherotrites archaeon]